MHIFEYKREFSLIRVFAQVLAEGFWTKVVSGYIWGKFLVAPITF
jgi:hypothetical protein